MTMTAVESGEFPFAVPPRVTSFIGGESVDSGGAHEIPSINPATEDVLTVLAEADADETAAAAAAARAAFDGGPWPAMDVAARKKVLLQIRDIVLDHAQELAFLEVLDSGLPMLSVEGMMIPRTGWNFEYFAEVASQAQGDAYDQTRPYVSYVTREPVGVGALIGPWNVPLGLCSMKIASCIAFGNTCVIKPSEYTPLSLRRLVELMHETDLPEGVVNLVNGRGHVTGDALVAHADVDVVSFTGGTSTGRAIMSRAGEGLKPVALELGGKSANIVCANADLDRALDGSLLSIYGGNGQQCLAGSRILVERSVADEFIDKFTKRCSNIVVGDPMDPATQIGPLCFEGHMKKVLSYVDIATGEGAELLTGGKRAAAHERGYYVEPTAVLAHSNDTRVCQEEIFGPFATFLKFDDLDEAIAIANATEYGLVAYIWSKDVATIMKASRDLRAGTVWVNTPITRELRAPFGGYKNSGVGRDSGEDCLHFFTEAKTTTIPVADFPLPKWGA